MSNEEKKDERSLEELTGERAILNSFLEEHGGMIAATKAIKRRYPKLAKSCDVIIAHLTVMVRKDEEDRDEIEELIENKQIRFPF